jgi:ribosomal protein L29
VTVNKNELKLVLQKLDTVKLELLRLRAMLLPEEEATEEEKTEIKEAKREIARGSKTSLEDLIKEIVDSDFCSRLQSPKELEEA